MENPGLDHEKIGPITKKPEQPTSFSNTTIETETGLQFDTKKALAQERTMLGRLGDRVKSISKVLLFISAFTAGETLASSAFAQDRAKDTITQKEGESKKTPLPEVVFNNNIPLELLVNDPVKTALSYRSPFNLKNERILEVPPEGQINFYENSLSAYGDEKDTQEINTNRISHELFHQQFDHLSPEIQEKIAEYFAKKYDFKKIKDYLVDKSLQYQDTFDKTKKYEDGDKRAKQFIINEFIAHAGAFHDYKPNEPEFLIDLLSDASDILEKAGFNSTSQKRLAELTQKKETLSEDEKKEKTNLQEKLTTAKKVAQKELRESETEDHNMWLKLKADAASTGIAYTRFDADYFSFQASGLDIDNDDLNFLNQNGFDTEGIKAGAKEILRQATEKKRTK
ncbi:MAG: hypothetical protein WA057_00940 [Candidatus Magasanikiibacteriota bacterium]